MSPTRDLSLQLRSGSANLTASAFSSVLQMDGTPIEGLAVQINIPSKAGTSPKLAVEVFCSTSTACDTTKTLVTSLAAFAPTAGQEVIVPFVAVDYRSMGVKLDVTGTSPNFGATSVHVVKNVGKTWDRKVRFH